MNACLERWEAVVSGRQRQTAIIAPDGSGLRAFGEIDEQAGRWEDRLGTGSGAVAVQIGNAAEWPEILLGAWRAGRTVVPFDADLTGDRRGRIERLCGVALRIERGIGGIAVVAVDSDPVLVNADLLKLTSGTTSEPQAVRFTGGQLAADCDNICETMGLQDSDRNFGVISFAHSYGFSNLLTPLFCQGIPLVVAADPMPRAILDGLACSGATVFPAVPAFFRALAELGPAPAALRLCLSAGAPLPAALAEKFRNAWGRKIHSFYGASECGGICYDASDEPAGEGFVGGALRGVEILAEGEQEPFAIRVRSAAVGEGYWPAGDAGGLGAGEFLPSDLLERRADGFALVGRKSDFINLAGRKVNPSEVEAVLQAAPGVREAVVFGLPDGSRGEEVAACIAGDVSAGQLRAHCVASLAPWQVPRQWFFVEEIPRNTRGKISRIDLRAAYAHRQGD